MRATWRWMLVTVAVAAVAATAQDAYFPYKPGVRLRYLTHTSLDESTSLRWEVSHLRTVDDGGDGQRVVVKVLAQRFETGQPWQRQERYRRGVRGLFTFGADDSDAPTLPLLPAMDRLESVDTVWHYEGLRPVPFALHLLTLIRNSDVPRATSGRYHVLSRGTIETAGGTFSDAVEVAGIERVNMPFPDGDPQDVMLRCRRWYARGLGLVQEDLAFNDLPRLGTLSTELTSYEGVAPARPPRPELAARPDRTAAREGE